MNPMTLISEQTELYLFYLILIKHPLISYQLAVSLGVKNYYFHADQSKFAIDTKCKTYSC